MRKHLTILLFLLAINYYAFSQADFWPYPKKGELIKIDSLKTELPHLTGIQKTDCLNAISDLYVAYNKDSAGIFAMNALNSAQKISYTAGRAKAYRNLGKTESMRIKNLPLAEKYFDTSLALYLTTHDEAQIAWAYGASGVSEWGNGKFPDAMASFENAENLFKKNQDTTNLVALYYFMFMTAMEWGHYAKALQSIHANTDITGQEDNGRLAAIYHALGDDSTAMEYAPKIITRSDYTGVEIFTCLAIADDFTQTKQYDSALHYLMIFSAGTKHMGPGPLTKLYERLGSLYTAQKQYDTAIHYLTGAVSMSKESNDRNQVMISLLLLANTYKDKGDYTNATRTADELLQTANETGARQHKRDAHFLLYQLFDSLKNPNGAYTHLRQYVALKDSIDLDLSVQKMAFYKIKAEREKSQAKINLLSEEKKLQQQQLKQTSQEKKFLFAGLTLLILIGLILFRNISLKRKAEKSRLQLTENQLKISTLEHERTEADLQQQTAELEMQVLRTQMNPHFIFNCLNAINGFIITNEAETAADYLTRFGRLIRMVLNNSLKKTISLEKELETLDLYLYMESLRYKDNFQYKINCDDNIDVAAVFIPPLLLQPIAENAVWHGLMNKDSHRELVVDLHFENNLLHCKITDNGVGRKKAAQMKSKSVEKNKSMGLEVTKNRLALLSQSLNGHYSFEIIDLEDEKGNAIGTSVSFTINVKETIQKDILEDAV